MREVLQKLTLQESLISFDFLSLLSSAATEPHTSSSYTHVDKTGALAKKK